MSEPQWEEFYDENDNTLWEAPSPFNCGDDVFCWRIRQRLADDVVELYTDHDPECGDAEYIFGTIEEAKAAVAEAHANLLNSVSDTE